MARVPLRSPLRCPPVTRRRSLPVALVAYPRRHADTGRTDGGAARTRGTGRKRTERACAARVLPVVCCRVRMMCTALRLCVRVFGNRLRRCPVVLVAVPQCAWCPPAILLRIGTCGHCLVVASVPTPAARRAFARRLRTPSQGVTRFTRRHRTPSPEGATR